MYELFFRGSDCEYMLHGVIFYFKVEFRGCLASYAARRSAIRDPDEKKFIWSKLLMELSQGYISCTASKLTYYQNISAVPKSSGGFKSIIDCSRPYDKSVNNYVDQVSKSFSYI